MCIKVINLSIKTQHASIIWPIYNSTSSLIYFMQNNLLSKTLSNGYLITPSSGLSVKGWHIFFTYKKVTLQFCLHFI